MNQCNDPADTYANIFYSRGNFIIFQTGPFPIALLSQYMTQVSAIGSPVYIETSGPNGNSFYEGSNWSGYGNKFGYPPLPTVGAIDAGGGRSCFGPVPCPTGTHWDLDKGECVPDNVLEIPPVVPDPPAQTCPPGYTWDPDLEMCLLPVGGGGGGNGGGGGGGGGFPPPPVIPLPPPQPPDGDEPGDCCALTAKYLYFIALAIESLRSQSGSGNTDCCTRLIAAIVSVQNTLGTIERVIESYVKNPKPGNLQEVTAAIGNLTEVVAGMPKADWAGADKIAAAISALKVDAPPPDPNVKRIADDFDVLIDDTDLEGDAFVDFLIQAGALDSSFGPPIKVNS